MKKYIFFFLAVAFFTTSCGKGEDQREVDERLINEYLMENNLVSESTNTGLHYIIDNPGSGEKPTLSDEIEIHYNGFYLDGQKFDSSYDRGKPFESDFDFLIQGWREGIPLYGKGGTGTLLIPSHLGYGPNPPVGVRPNAVLVFEIELLNIIPG